MAPRSAAHSWPTVDSHVQVHKGPVLDMDVDATGTLVATGSADNTVKVWDIEKGHMTHNFTGHSGVVTRVAFHPDPSRLQLVSCSEDGTVRLWDLNTNQCVLSFLVPPIST